MPESSLRLYPFCPFTNKPCPAEPALRMLRAAGRDTRSQRFRSLEALMLRQADKLLEEFGDERMGSRAVWADREAQGLSVHSSYVEITPDEYDVITGGFRACMAKRCDELNPPPETV